MFNRKSKSSSKKKTTNKNTKKNRRERGRQLQRQRDKKQRLGRSKSRTRAEDKELARKGARVLRGEPLEARAKSSSAQFSVPVSSTTWNKARIKAQQRKGEAKKATKAKKAKPTLSLTAALIRNQIDKTTNMAADKQSMNRIFQLSERMPDPLLSTDSRSRSAFAGQKSSANQVTGHRSTTEAGLSISPVFQCRTAINSILRNIATSDSNAASTAGTRADWLSSVPFGFKFSSGGQGEAIAANVLNAGVTINKRQWEIAFGENFDEAFSLTPPPDPRFLPNEEYIEYSRTWKLRYSWMTMLPLLWGVDPPQRSQGYTPLHCEHKLPLFWLAAFGCGPETKLAIYSNISLHTGIVEDIAQETGVPIRDIHAQTLKVQAVGALSDYSAGEKSRSNEVQSLRRARVSDEYIALKHTVREECYAWEFPCVNSAIKSQMIFINLILNEGELYYVIARRAISNYVEGLATNTSSSCVQMWNTILMNILKARGVNINNWDRINEELVSLKLKKKSNKKKYLKKDIIDLINRRAGDSDEGIIGLVNDFLDTAQKSRLPRQQYTKKYIYDSMVIQLLKLTSLLNKTVNDKCKWGSPFNDGGIRNNLYLNYIRLARFCEKNDRYADKLGATQETGTGHWNQPTTGMFTMLRNLRNNNTTLRQAANDYIAQIRNANGQISISTSNLSNLRMRGGSLILPNGKRVSLGNSDFSVDVNEYFDIEEQQEIEEEVEEVAANLGGYYADAEDTSSSSGNETDLESTRQQQFQALSSSSNTRALQQPNIFSNTTAPGFRTSPLNLPAAPGIRTSPLTTTTSRKTPPAPPPPPPPLLNTGMITPIGNSPSQVPLPSPGSGYVAGSSANVGSRIQPRQRSSSMNQRQLDFFSPINQDELENQLIGEEEEEEEEEEDTGYDAGPSQNLTQSQGNSQSQGKSQNPGNFQGGGKKRRRRKRTRKKRRKKKKTKRKRKYLKKTKGRKRRRKKRTRRKK